MRLSIKPRPAIAVKFGERVLRPGRRPSPRLVMTKRMEVLPCCCAAGINSIRPVEASTHVTPRTPMVTSERLHLTSSIACIGAPQARDTGDRPLAARGIFLRCPEACMAKYVAAKPANCASIIARINKKAACKPRGRLFRRLIFLHYR